jgi:hypothetical protein
MDPHQAGLNWLELRATSRARRCAEERVSRCGQRKTRENLGKERKAPVIAAKAMAA